jgi:transcriptional regulator with XRE-family HTH domain
VASTNAEIAARFALQMAEQTRKFGQRLTERRLEVGFKHQKDLVARMQELGDKGLNTNQLSRYESGEGPLPREQRLEWFAEALKTNTADLLSGAVAERSTPGATPDLLLALDGGANPQLDRIEHKLNRLLIAAGLDLEGDEASDVEPLAGDVPEPLLPSERARPETSEEERPAAVRRGGVRSRQAR